MRILVCGSCMPQQFEYKIKDLAAASNQYHLNMIKALKEFSEVEVLSYIGMNLNGVSENEIELACKDENIECVFKRNNPIKAFFEYQQKLKKIVKWADIIITYNIQYVWFGIGRIAAKYGKKAILVWADHTPVSEKKSVGGKLYAYLSEINAREYQKVVALSPNMSSYLSKNQEHIISHGCVDFAQFNNYYYKKPDQIMNIMFSGLLAPVTGVDLLLKSLPHIKRNDIRIIITGKGPLEKEVCNVGDRRIDYRGFVTRDQYHELLREADVLINPRNMSLAENQNNFPSKMLEYLATGKYIISTRYSGWEDYKGYCNFVDSTPEMIAAAIDSISISDVSAEVYERNREMAASHVWSKEIKRFL